MELNPWPNLLILTSLFKLTDHDEMLIELTHLSDNDELNMKKQK